jgi:hypothetical protein
MLHPKYESKAELRLKEVMCVEKEAEEVVSEPLKLHVLLISIYLSSWRDYILHYEEELLALVSNAYLVVC